MKTKKLLVVFTKKDSHTNKYLVTFSLDQMQEYGFFNSSNSKKDCIINDPDVIICMDASGSWNKINNLNNYHEIYVCLHVSSAYKEAQKDYINKNFTNSKIFYIEQHHNSGYVFDNLIELSKSYGKDKNQYDNILVKLFQLIKNESLYSLKILLLKLLLNKKVIDDTKDPFNKLTTQVFWKKKLNELNPKINNDIGNNTVKQIVEELQNDVNNGYEEYLIKNDKKIKALRDALFGSD